MPEVIEGFKQAWRFFGGAFAVVIPDSMKAIVIEADAITPRFNTALVEYGTTQRRSLEVV